MVRDICSRCGSKKTKTFWEHQDGSILCDKCEKQIGSEWENNINQKRQLLLLGILVVILIFIIIVIGIAHVLQTNAEQTPNSLTTNYNPEPTPNNQLTKTIYSLDCGNGICNNNETCSTCTSDCGSCELNTIDKVKKITQDYASTHTYSLPDFFVCSDMAIDTWNLLKTNGINAEICAGNVDTDLTSHLENNAFDSFLSNMNHAWVLAETEPFKFLAVETTGGYVVWGNNSTTDEPKNDLYYKYAKFCFQTPGQFKKFSDLRTKYLEICPQAKTMQEYWNTYIAGTQMTYENQEFKGQMQTKIDECENTTTQLITLITT